MRTYVPVIRETAYERDALSALGGLAEFSEDEPEVEVVPLVEVVESGWRNVVNRLSGSMNSPLFIDVPRYLEEEYSVDSDVTSVLAGYSGRLDFFKSNHDIIDVPVVSSSANNPVYHEILLEIEALQEEFDEAVPRIILRNAPLGDRSKENLTELAASLNDSSTVLVDFYDIGIESHSQNNFKWVASTFDAHDIIVLDVYDTESQPARNYGPTFADIHSLAGFGDFLGGPRFVYPSQSRGVTVRHYFFNDFEVREFPDDDTSSALDRLRESPDWNGQHCPHCKILDRLDEPSIAELGRHRTGHYIHSIRDDTYEIVASREPNQYDPEGRDIIR